MSGPALNAIRRVVREELGVVNKRIDMLERAKHSRFNRVEKRFDVVEARFAEIEKRLERLAVLLAGRNG